MNKHELFASHTGIIWCQLFNNNQHADEIFRDILIKRFS